MPKSFPTAWLDESISPTSGTRRSVAQLDGPDIETTRDEVRSVAQLDMLHNLAAALNMLGDVEEIGAAIAAELRTIIDYHNCRVYVLQDDGITLFPIAFRGELFTEYATETLDDLVTNVGEGITGHVAVTKESLLTPDARQVSFSVTIAGTEDDLLESMLAVPMIAGDEVVGVIVLSKLGYGQFDMDDQRLLEVLASHAAVAFQTARLLEAERREARISSSLLRLSQALTAERAIGEIFQRAIEAIPTIVDCIAAAAYTRDRETGAFRLERVLVVGPHEVKPRTDVADVPKEVADRFVLSETEPFVLSQGDTAQVQDDLWFKDRNGPVLVTPLRWDPDGSGAIIVVGEPDGIGFDDSLSVARGIADITSLALGNASRISELERSERTFSEAFQREREAAQQLRALDEMKNTFLEAVSHDLRTPLTSILGSAITLERSNMGLPTEDAVDLVRRIAANARKLERLLSDLLDLDRLQRGIVTPQRRPVDVAELIGRSVDETEDRNGHVIHVIVDPFHASIDAPKVERIVENLVTNAFRHTPAGSEVWVRGAPKDGGLLLIVEDDGPGIPPDLRDEVFEPFRQAPGSATGHSPGVGVGLSLVKRFAELHGGRAWVEDRAGGGASFRVFLPGG
jgi:signal transduction histidine kinase/GAF domain-containing protein